MDCSSWVYQGGHFFFFFESIRLSPEGALGYEAEAYYSLTNLRRPGLGDIT